MRQQQNGHNGAVLWFTGLSGAGKSTMAHAVEEELFRRGHQAFVLDGDNVRHGLCSDLGFSVDDRTENIRRIGEVTKLFVEAGVIILAAFISPIRADRDGVRHLIGGSDFLEVYCRCPLTICEQRDVKGLYARARRGEIPNFTGISAPFEEPLRPELIVDTDVSSIRNETDRVIDLLCSRGLIPKHE
jgi:adenylylsulfate kinase